MTDWYMAKHNLEAVDELLLMLINEDATEYEALIRVIEDNYKGTLEALKPLIDKAEREEWTERKEG